MKDNQKELRKKGEKIKWKTEWEKEEKKEKVLDLVLSANHNFLPILDGKRCFLLSTGNSNKT